VVGPAWISRGLGILAEGEQLAWKEERWMLLPQEAVAALQQGTPLGWAEIGCYSEGWLEKWGSFSDTQIVIEVCSTQKWCTRTCVDGRDV
jgi:hypothetical protein